MVVGVMGDSVNATYTQKDIVNKIMNISPTLPNNADRTVTFILDVHLDSFINIKEVFVSELAALLETSENQIKIVSMRKGCVILVLEIPNDARDRLKNYMDSGDLPPELDLFRNKFNVEKIRIGPLESPYINILKELIQEGRTLTWLQLSDLHMRSDGGAKGWDQDIVTDKLVENISQLLSEFGLVPDMVFFTGDIALSGKKEEYQNAKEFLQNLIYAIPGKPGFCAVPGNHDITWENIDSKDDEEIRSQLGSTDAVNSFFLDDKHTEQKRRHLTRFSEYRDFIVSVGDMGHPALNEDIYYSEDIVIPNNGISVGVAGLNSAWLSTRKDSPKKDYDIDLENMVVGEPQLLTSLKSVAKSDLRIALIHHPPDTNWFKYYDREVQRALFSQFDFVLRGHEHSFNALGVNILGANRSAIHVASGSLYQGRRYTNGFNVVRLNADAGTCAVFSWRYYKEAYKWGSDISFSDHGYFQFKIPAGIRDRFQNNLPRQISDN